MIAANCNIMAKGSVVTSLIKLIPTCGQKKVQLLKCVLIFFLYYMEPSACI